MLEHIFKTSFSTNERLEPSLADSLADLLYEIGKEQSDKADDNLAVRWLERSLEIIEQQSPCEISTDANELRISTIQALIKSLFAQKKAEYGLRAGELISLLEHELGDRMIVLLLKIEQLNANPDGTVDSASYANILLKMTKSMILDEANINVFLKHVRVLRHHDYRAACKVCEGMLRMRSHRDGRGDWFEKVLVTRFWLASDHEDDSESIEDLTELLGQLAQHSQQRLSPAATIAIHTVSRICQHHSCAEASSCSGKELKETTVPSNLALHNSGVA